MFSHLVTGIYKKVLRSAQQFDKHPFLKGLLSLQSFESFYNGKKDHNVNEFNACKTLLETFLENRTYYTYDKSLFSFVREQIRMPNNQLDSETQLNLLLLIDEYLHSQQAFAERLEYLSEDSQSILPCPRETRECYDRVKPCLESSSLSDYSNCLLLQNPSLVLHFRQPGTKIETISGDINSLVMMPISVSQSLYTVTFLSDSQMPSTDAIPLKHELIRLAWGLRNEHPSMKKATKEVSFHTRKRRSVMNEVFDPVDVKADTMKDYLSTLSSNPWKSVYEEIHSIHPVLGKSLYNPVVLFDPSSLSKQDLDSIQYVNHSPTVAVSYQYERVLTALNHSVSTKDSLPLCLAGITNTIPYPLSYRVLALISTVDTIHQAIQEKQLIPVRVEDVRDLVYNNTLNHRTIYPNILKRLGGEYAQCADVIYRELSTWS